MLSLRDELYLRPTKLKIFVSSQMRGAVLDAEREAAAQAIESTDYAVAWYWERDAKAGPYSSEHLCLGHARTSDGLVLLLASDLTPITQREYTEAFQAGAPCYIFLKDGHTLSPHTSRFVQRERAHCITSCFQNASELCTLITAALLEFSNRAVREEILRARCQRASSTRGLNDLRRALMTRFGRKGGPAR